MIRKITAAYVRTYSDTHQRTAYVEWVDQHGHTGRTEGNAQFGLGLHMQALFDRAKREGVEPREERW